MRCLQKYPADISGICHQFGRNRKWISGTSLKESVKQYERGLKQIAISLNSHFYSLKLRTHMRVTSGVHWVTLTFDLAFR